MRGSDAASGALFSYVDMEARVPATHPLRTIRTIVNEVLAALDTEFEALYEGIGRQSVAPERLLRASLLQAFYSSASALMMPFGIIRRSRRTGSGCSAPMSLPSSSPVSPAASAAPAPPDEPPGCRVTSQGLLVVP